MNQAVITEEWRKVPGFKPIYEVSNFGEVRSKSDVARGQKLKPRADKFSGLPLVRVMGQDGKRRWCPVHVMVAKAFPEEES